MVTHLQAHFCQISLGTQIQIEVSIQCLPHSYNYFFPIRILLNFERISKDLPIALEILVGFD